VLRKTRHSLNLRKIEGVARHIHECYTSQIALVYNHRANRVSLLLYAGLEVDIPSRGIREANELCLGASFGHDVGGSDEKHPCLAEHDVIFPVGLMHPIGGVNESAYGHAISHGEHDAMIMRGAQVAK